MRPDEIPLAIDWAAQEGWNPGHADAACFAAVDPQGFMVGELAGEPIATISCVNYDESFSFLGFYIVRRDVRHRGYGRRIWDAAMAHAGRRTVGLDGVVEQQANYRESGFEFAYANIRYRGQPAGRQSGARRQVGVVPVADVPMTTVEADDATVFPAPRATFLRVWTSASGHIGRAVLRDDRLAGWGVIRPCRVGWKVGPLVADDRLAAESVMDALVQDSGATEIYLDVPSVNREAVALAEGSGMVPTFETARMYTGPVKALRLDRLYGVTSFELG